MGQLRGNGGLLLIAVIKVSIIGYYPREAPLYLGLVGKGRD
jgi:hypothetical protein